MTPLCTRQEPTEAKEETRTQATGRRRQRDSSTTTLPIRRQPKEKEKAKHQRRENPPRRTRSLVRLKWTDAKQKEPVSTVEKKDIHQQEFHFAPSAPGASEALGAPGANRCSGCVIAYSFRLDAYPTRPGAPDAPGRQPSSILHLLSTLDFC